MKMNSMEKIQAYGHKNILCNHNSTIEITKDKYLTKNGNCIVGIKASKSCRDLNQNIKRAIKKGKRFKIIIKLGKLKDSFYGYGSSNLKLKDPIDMVFRKSNYVSDRTVLINCTKAAIDLDRNLVNKLKTPNIKFDIFLMIDNG
jgi:uncharacterized protein